MKAFTTLAVILALTTAPVYAGGPVLIVEDEYDVTEPAPRNDWVVPVIIGAVILCALACGGDDDAPVVQPPKETCFKDC